MSTVDVTNPAIVTNEFTLLDSQRQSDAAHTAVLAPPRRAHRDRRAETVAVFLDLGGGGTRGLAQAMLERFQQSYWRCSGPVTSALRRAIGAANTHLQEENRLMPVSHRREAGPDGCVNSCWLMAADRGLAPAR